MKLIFILDYGHFGSGFLAAAKRAAPYCDRIWFRIKSFPDASVYRYAAELRAAVPDRPLILSERADIAVCAGFEGVHLNSRTPPPEAIKQAFPALITGYSAHSAAECAVESTYVTLSPIFPTQKAHDSAGLGPIPSPAGHVYALGGVSLETLPFLKGKGYEGVAGISLYYDIERIYESIKT